MGMMITPSRKCLRTIALAAVLASCALGACASKPPWACVGTTSSDSRLAAPLDVAAGLAEAQYPHRLLASYALAAPPAAAAGAGAGALRGPAPLAVYYGWPSQVNGAAGDVGEAVKAFAAFSTVVLGDGLEAPTHGDHDATVQIVAGLSALGTEVYGYIDLGVSTGNLSTAEFEALVDQWATLGAKGIFWDDAGTDYKVDRQRLITAVDYCHNRGLKVMVNAWNVKDVAAANTPLRAGDTYLSESFLVSGGKYTNLADWKTKADLCAKYRDSLGIRIACLSSLAPKAEPDSAADDRYTMAWTGAALYGFDLFQMTDLWYSAGNNSLAALPPLAPTLGSAWQSKVLTDHVDKHPVYSRTTDTTTLRIAGDGATWGRGELVPNP